MTKRDEYLYNDALNDLEQFFIRHIKDKRDLNYFLEIIDNCRNAHRVSFRFIQNELMKYRKENSNYFEFSEEEKVMMKDLMYFWG